MQEEIKMRDYVITVNSTVDLPKEWLEERHVPVVPLKYTIDGQTYTDMEGLSAKEFFDKLREGKMSVTSQVNPEEAMSLLEPYVQEGKHILHLGFSSGLSGTFNSMKIAGEMLSEKYPEAKVIVIDTLCACLGEGLLLHKALQEKAKGKTIDEVAQWVEENKLHICHNVTVDDLNHLQRGGRVSKTTAVVGSLVNIKPILTVTSTGELKADGTVRGRKKSLKTLVSRMEAALDTDAYGKDRMVAVLHGDCIDDANMVADMVKGMGFTNVVINDVSPSIGTHAGPGVVGLVFYGKKRL